MVRRQDRWIALESRGQGRDSSGTAGLVRLDTVSGGVSWPGLDWERVPLKSSVRQRVSSIPGHPGNLASNWGYGMVLGVFGAHEPLTRGYLV